MNVVFAGQARTDLAAIRRWIARDDRARAISFVRELRSKAQSLNQLPERFPEVDPQRYPGLRRLNYGNYRILYEVSHDRVLILRVQHGRRDYPDA